MVIREYKPSDCAALVRLFRDTVHTVNAKDYTKEQLNAWAPESADLEKWNRSLSAHYTLVALEGETVVGFGDIDKTGCLDRLFVHQEHQRKGIATTLCDKLEQAAPGETVTHASITARPFFESRGYRAVKQQQVELRGVLMTNYVMKKKR